jgi:hypothetical protein
MSECFVLVLVEGGGGTPEALHSVVNTMVYITIYNINHPINQWINQSIEFLSQGDEQGVCMYVLGDSTGIGAERGSGTETRRQRDGCPIPARIL